MNLGGIFDLPSKQKELEDLEKEAMESDFWNNSQRVQTVNQRISTLKEEIGEFDKLQNSVDDLKVLLELAIEEDDSSLESEIQNGLTVVKTQFDKIELRLMLDGEFDENNAILNIHPGAGGIDAQDWAGMLMRMYLRWCDQRSFTTEIVDLTAGDEAGIKGATILVKGTYVYGYLKAESGVHRLVRLSPFDFNNRRHTSFAAVHVTPEIDDSIDVEINAEDLRIDTYRASGAGGQHVNVTDSAVRITHKPTNIMVQCQNERSQHKNRDIAMKVLRSRLYDHFRAQRDEELAKLQPERRNIDFGSQIRSYVLHPYQRVKDTRTNIETGNVDAVLNGEIDEFIESFLKLKPDEK